MIFGVSEQPNMVSLLDGNSSTCLSASAIQDNLPMIQLRIPWPHQATATITIVGDTSMTCNISNSIDSAPVTLLYQLANKRTTLDLVEPGLVTTGKVCLVVSENIISDQKECIFNCQCNSAVFSSIFLSVMNRNIEICDITLI